MHSKAFALVVAALVLSSCGFTGTGDAVRAVVADKGGQAMDEGLANAEWFMCSAVSVGAVRRRYGRSPQLATAYEMLCRHRPSLTPGAFLDPSPPEAKAPGQAVEVPPEQGSP